MQKYPNITVPSFEDNIINRIDYERIMKALPVTLESQEVDPGARVRSAIEAIHHGPDKFDEISKKFHLTPEQVKDYSDQLFEAALPKFNPLGILNAENLVRVAAEAYCAFSTGDVSKRHNLSQSKIVALENKLENIAREIFQVSE